MSSPLVLLPGLLSVADSAPKANIVVIFVDDYGYGTSQCPDEGEDRPRPRRGSAGLPGSRAGLLGDGPRV